MAVSDYCVVDIMKPEQTFVDLTNYFQARVGDARAYCKLWIKSGHQPLDMTGKRVDFYGKDSNATVFKTKGTFLDDQPGDDLQLGMGTFYFPEGIFQKEGKWQEAYFKIVDGNGAEISTIDLTLNVYPNQVEMGITIKPFVPDLTRVEGQVNQALREMGAQQLLNQLQSMKTTIGAYTDLIEQHAVLNKPQTQALIDSSFGKYQQQITDQTNQMKSQLDAQMQKINDATANIGKSNWNYKRYAGTLLNGCSGWTSGELLYDNTVVVGRLMGYVSMPAGDHAIDFSNNPLGSAFTFTNYTLQQHVTFYPTSNPQGKRGIFDCRLDGDDKLTLYNAGIDGQDGDAGAGDIFFNIVFTGVAQGLK